MRNCKPLYFIGLLSLLILLPAYGDFGNYARPDRQRYDSKPRFNVNPYANKYGNERYKNQAYRSGFSINFGGTNRYHSAPQRCAKYYSYDAMGRPILVRKCDNYWGGRGYNNFSPYYRNPYQGW